MNKTDIDYLDYTWNPTKGCSAISEGCAHCWAKTMARRLAGMGTRGYSKENPFAVMCCPWRLDEPLKVKKPSRIGVSFMGDLFHKDVPFEFIDRVWTRILYCPQHDFIILTKRPDRMAEFVSDVGVFNYDVLSNLWLGVSVSNQSDADKFIPILLQIPASRRFVSVEPMLGPVDLCLGEDGIESGGPQGWVPGPTIDWVICGAETGPGARRMHPDWARGLRDQCVEAKVPFFFKSWGQAFGRAVNRKDKTSRMIDGRLWEQYPERSE